MSESRKMDDTLNKVREALELAATAAEYHGLEPDTDVGRAYMSGRDDAAEDIRALNSEPVALKIDSLDRTIASVAIKRLEEAHLHNAAKLFKRLIDVASSAPTNTQDSLRITVKNHCADLQRCAVELDKYPQFAATAAEVRTAADELLAALASSAQPAQAQVVPEGWRDRLDRMRDARHTYSQYPELFDVIIDSVEEALSEL